MTPAHPSAGATPIGQGTPVPPGPASHVLRGSQELVFDNLAMSLTNSDHACGATASSGSRGDLVSRTHTKGAGVSQEATSTQSNPAESQ